MVKRRGAKERGQKKERKIRRRNKLWFEGERGGGRNIGEKGKKEDGREGMGSGREWLRVHGSEGLRFVGWGENEGDHGNWEMEERIVESEKTGN
jgi:hypothetical protein